MMRYDFDSVIDRRSSDSHKWKKYGHDVIPLWVADMDFVSAEPVIQALHDRVDHGIFGYTRPPEELSRVILGRFKRLYGWEVGPEHLLFLPGLVVGLNVAIHAYARPGEEILVQPPVYFHFLKDPVHHGRVLRDPPLIPRGETYEVDFDAFEKAITPETRLFILCNPHNPVGRVYTRAELERMAEICLRHNLVICSDEIHCDLVFPGFRHIPMASLSPEVADRTVTLMAPSKTYNLAGLQSGIAVISNPELRCAWTKASTGIVPGANIMGHVAALAAFRNGQEWLDQVLAYLRENRDYLSRTIEERFPSLRMCRMEATYLAWIDCRKTPAARNPADFFLRRARVALNEGTDFGKGGEGFVRLNFACPRSTLAEALDRMASALDKA
jgi:cystathionine beta-lyase